MINLTAYTDGGFSYHENIGSWAFIAVIDQFEVERFGLVEHHKHTSQIAEITAILNTFKFAFEEVAKSNVLTSKKIDLKIISDSQYCVNTINDWMHSWQKAGWPSEKKNLDLWKQIYQLYFCFNTVKLVWVKGHAGHEMNERVDKLTQIPLEKYRK